MQLLHEIPLTHVRVMFSQIDTDTGDTTASLRHAVGPLRLGELVLAYELDGDDTLVALCRVKGYEHARRVYGLRPLHSPEPMDTFSK